MIKKLLHSHIRIDLLKIDIQQCSKRITKLNQSTLDKLENAHSDKRLSR